MPKYDELMRFLQASSSTEIVLSFSELESILGFPLPRSAYSYPMWWANGGHTQAVAWLKAGFKVQQADLKSKTVLFCKTGALLSSSAPTRQKPHVSRPFTQTPPFAKEVDNGDMVVCGYTFSFLQELMPVCECGKPKEFYPETVFDNKDHLPLHANGHGPFCRFSIDAPAVPGVYLWVVNGEIIYIGETVNLQQRFNVGYGNISPRNCYLGGQSTNCKMNKVVLKNYVQGKAIKLYFLQTHANKEVELELLNQVKTRYNVKDN